MKRKIFSVLLALALVLSFSLVTSVPAMANPGTLNVIPIPMELNMAGGLSEWSIAMSHTGSNSIHLKTISPDAGAEARAVIMASSVGVDTLADIDSVSWWEYLEAGYPPHIDIGLDIDGNGSPDDWLVIEYAYNTSEGDVRPEGQPNYGAETGAWYQTFNDDGNGPVAIDDNAYAWLTSQAAGPVGGEFGADGHYGATLADWKAGQTVPGVGEISASTVVTHFVIEVDNWRTPLVQADVYVDDVAFNVNGMAYFGSIQYAIDSAQPNDTINVAAGTYIEDLVIPDTKTNLELAGASGATIKGVQNVLATLWPLAVPNIDIWADGVKIHGFTIEGPDHVADYYASGIVLDGTSIEIYDNDFVTTAADTTDELSHAITTYSKAVVPTADVSGLNIHDNTFTGYGAIGSEFIYIDPHTGTGAITIDANQFSGSVFVGITAESGEVSCTNNTINNGAAGSGLYGIRFMDTTYLANYGNILISGNTIQNTDKAIRVGNGGAGASVFTAVISNNTLTDNTIGIWGRLGNHITAANNTIVGNTVGVQNDDATVTINAENNWWGDASGPKQSTTNPSATGDEVSDYVGYTPWLDATYPGGSERDHNVENITQVTTHNSIQSAIDAANPGDTISVAAGTYSVTSVINVNLANLIISGASATTTIVDGSGKNASIVDGADVLFNVTASGVTIEDMTIDLGDDTTDFDVGVLTPNGGGIDDLTVQNCTLLYAAFGNDPGEQLIHLGGGTGATITGNAFDVATGNSMIYVGEDVANGDNDLLTVSNNTAAPVASTAGGAGDTDGGGTFFNQFGPLTNSTISGNTFTDTGIAVYLGSGSLAATDNVSVTSNTFNSTATGAIMITSEVDGVATGNIMVTNNTFTGSTGGYGAISIFDWDPTTADVDGSTITINNNNFAGDNTGGGVVVGAGVSGTPVDATMNWWGDISGPTHTSNPSGTGDAVSDYVDFTPWLPQWYSPAPAPAPAPPPPPTIDTELFGTEASFETNSDGEIQETIVATSEDENVTITIEEGTIALDIEGEPLETLTAAVEPSPPEPPEDTYLIGAYGFGPAGASFDPPLTLTWSYDPETLPEDVDLVIAYYDEVNEEWVWVPCEVDTENNIITASVAHFTTFAIIAVPVVTPPAPAVFIVSSLGISPSEVAPSEEVNTSVLVANTGGESGSYTAVLKIDGVKEAEKTVTIAAGSSQTVSFSVTREEAGSYTVTVDGLSGSFTVAPVVVPPEPAAFSVSYLSVSPEVEPNEAVTITVFVANTGGESGSYTVVLKIDGVKEAEETVTVAAGDSQEVSFSVTKEEAGSYTVAVNGLSGSFTVVALPPGVNWPLIGGIIAGVVVVGLLTFFFLRRRAA